MELIPINGKMVIKPLNKDAEETSTGGIFLPSTAESDILAKAEVISVDTAGLKTEPQVQPGDIILYDKHSRIWEYEDKAIINMTEVISVLRDKCKSSL